MWWRIWVPTWRFFDSTGIHPELFVRGTGDWVRAVNRPRSHWYSLFFNPQFNHYHACNNLLERLILELAELGTNHLEDLVSYQLMQDLARQFIRAQLLPGHRFEFKLSIQGQDILVGPVPLVPV
jgi:hypothetical protein